MKPRNNKEIEFASQFIRKLLWAIQQTDSSYACYCAYIIVVAAGTDVGVADAKIL